MHIQLTDAARAYILSKGADSITVKAVNRSSCCTVDYTSIVSLGTPPEPYGYQRVEHNGIDIYASGFVTGIEKDRTLTVKLLDLKLKKMLILDKNE